MCHNICCVRENDHSIQIFHLSSAVASVQQFILSIDDPVKCENRLAVSHCGVEKRKAARLSIVERLGSYCCLYNKDSGFPAIL